MLSMGGESSETRSLRRGLIIVHDEQRASDVIHVFDEVDLATSADFEAELGRFDGSRPLIVDLTECRYVDCSVIAVFIRAEKRLAGKLHFAVAESSLVQRVLKLTQVDRLLSFVPPPVPTIAGAPRLRLVDTA